MTPSVWLPLEWGPLYSQTRESLEAESCSYYVCGTQVIPRWPAQSLLTSEALGWKFLVLPEQDPPRHGVILPVLPREGPRATVHPSKAAEWQHRGHCIPWRPQGGCVMEAFHAPEALHHPPPLLAPLHGPDHPGHGPWAPPVGVRVPGLQWQSIPGCTALLPLSRQVVLRPLPAERGQKC